MILSNLNTNHKIMLGVSAITLLAIIYKYVQNMLKPKQKMIEGQTGFDERYGTRTDSDNNKTDTSYLGVSGSLIGAELTSTALKNLKVLQGIYDELGEFNHIYQERMFEQIMPSQILKTIIHLSSINNTTNSGIDTINNIYNLADKDSSGHRSFKNVINIKLLGALMPYVPQNIYADLLTDNSPDKKPSNILYFISGDIVEVTPGYYTIYSLISTLNNSMAASGLGNFSFNNITKLLTLNGNASGISGSGVLYKKLGFQSPGNLNNTTNNIPDLSIHYIDIVYGDMAPKAATLTKNDGKILKRIPLNGQPGDMIYYDAPHSDYLSQDLFMPDINAHISNIEIILKRHDSSLYNLLGLHYDLKLEITELVEPTLLNAMDAHMKRDRTRFFEKDGVSNVSGIGGTNSSSVIDVNSSFLSLR